MAEEKIMKQKSIFRVLMALMVMGVVSASCTNVDNPYNNTAPDGKYVAVGDSVITSAGLKRLAVWEYDAEGRMAKETADFYYSDGTTEHQVSTFTYSQNMITRKTVKNDAEITFAYFYLNSKGLVERYKDEMGAWDCSFEYDDNDCVANCIEDGLKDSVIWKNGDVVSYIGGGNDPYASFFTSSSYEVNFPYLMPYLLHMDSALTLMGFFGKATRHLISNIRTEGVYEGKDLSRNMDFSYVVQNGLVKEFILDINESYTANGETEKFTSTQHHYFTWKKL